MERRGKGSKEQQSGKLWSSCGRTRVAFNRMADSFWPTAEKILFTTQNYYAVVTEKGRDEEFWRSHGVHSSTSEQKIYLFVSQQFDLWLFSGFIWLRWNANVLSNRNVSTIRCFFAILRCILHRSSPSFGWVLAEAAALMELSAISRARDIHPLSQFCIGSFSVMALSNAAFIKLVSAAWLAPTANWR